MKIFRLKIFVNIYLGILISYFSYNIKYNYLLMYSQYKEKKIDSFFTKVKMYKLILIKLLFQLFIIDYSNSFRIILFHFKYL